MRLLRAWHGVRDRSTAGHVVGRHAHREHTERGRNEVNSIKENLISEIKFGAEQVYGGGAIRLFDCQPSGFTRNPLRLRAFRQFVVCLS